MLEQYGEKRDFGRTPEPAPAPGPRRRTRLLFVVQKHAASRLHYDFRLEIDGVLKSWPVPKGPSLDPAEKRLAVMVEDHPLDYASFEGVIPKGEYGGGQVIVWDAGTYSPDEDGKLSFDDPGEAQARMREGLAKGKLSFFLRGHKLKGSWTLVKLARGKDEWLFIKHKDRFADPERDILEEDRSVLSGLTIADLKAGHLPDRGQRLIAEAGDLAGARPAPFPRLVETMQATLTEKAFSSPEWLFEPKMDGVRAVALIRRGKVRLQSRRGLDLTRQYPAIAEELARQSASSGEPELVLDGEIVALDEGGAPSFQLLQQRGNLTREADIRRAESQIPAYYYVFDALYAGGYDLRAAPLVERKDLLEQLLPSDHVRLLEHFRGEGEAAYEAAIEHGLEGVVAKKRDSVYESGRRTRTWLKVKATRADEFVIGGFTAGAGARAKTFGSLLLGQYDDGGRLVFAGHVGTGFDDRTLEDLRQRLEALKTDECPFGEEPTPPALGGFGRPKSTAVAWVRPELVASVKFAQWTDDNRLRAPSFQGLRPDKAPPEVRRERAVPPPSRGAADNTRDGASDADVADVLEQLRSSRDAFVLKVMGRKLHLSNLDKEFWPALPARRALTKRDLLTYLARVSPYLLPHMRDRPLTLTRYPNGIAAEHFYQKHWEASLPDYVSTVTLFSEQFQKDQEYLICDNLPTLLWLGQMADIELHTWYSRVNPAPDGYGLGTVFTGSTENIDASLLNYPDFIVFDLDPYIYSGKEARGAEPELNRQAFRKTCEVALWLKELLDSLSLSSFVKTTGKTGLHIYVPVLRQLDYDPVRSAAGTIGRFLMRAHPKDVTMEWPVPKRAGKVFFDHNQNSRGKTLASIYSPRPSPEAAVSMPLRWDELQRVYPTDFTLLTAPERLEQTGDLWANILNEKHDVSALLQGDG